ncbi:Cubilin [Holothuria leucospilota]|uniref:Cubilin n=1 Tax=Holothuria leucospilota TaxID=206669 RepID=A0A9Q1HBH6_HOLLE|nr:Cubilin [Holothuria leucospilota]
MVFFLSIPNHPILQAPEHKVTVKEWRIAPEYSLMQGIECRDTFNVSGSRFTSPNFPFLEPPGLYCEYVAKASEGEKVELAFTEFDVGDFSLDCLEGSVKVYDGNSTNDPLIAIFCGHILPRNVYSSSKEMLVTYNSTFSSFQEGFEAFFYFLNEETDRSCFEEVRESAIIRSYYYPRDVTTCTHQIQAPGGLRVVLIFTSVAFNIFSSDCLSNELYQFGVWVLDGNHEKDPVLLRHCMFSLPHPVKATGNEMLVISTAIPYLAPFGFSAVVKFVDPSQCMETIVLSGSLITSPSFENNALCYYLIVAPEGSTITLSFTFFSLEEHPDCIYDSLKIWKLPKVCRQLGLMNLRQRLGRKSRHHLTRVEPPGLYCEYVATASEGQRVELIFTSFSVGRLTVDCLQDSVKVYDGNSTNDPLIATLCGPLLPRNVYSSGKDMFVTFNSTIYFSEGFEAFFYFQSEEALAYVYINDLRDELTPDSHQGAVFFSDSLNLNSIIYVFDGNHTTDPVLLRHCSRSLPHVVEASGNQMLVISTTTPYLEEFDFAAVVKFVDPKFHNKELQNDHGRLSCDNGNPCLGSHVSCMDDSTDPYCVCESGYQFVDSSQLECIEFHDRGFQNDGKSSCENANPCLGSHVTCMDDSTDPYCVCERGYQFVDSSQRECIDVNECLGGLDDCEPSANLVCFNEEGGYSCQCLDGFTITANGTCQKENSAITSDVEPDISTLLAFRITAINQKTAVFSTELLDENSDQFNLMASFTCSSVMEAFSGIPSIADGGCSALGFRSGSINVFLQLEITPGETALSTKSMEETFMSKLYDDSHGFKVLQRANGDSITIDENSVIFECKQRKRSILMKFLVTSLYAKTEALVNLTRKSTKEVAYTVSVMTQNRSTFVLFILIPFAFAASLMFFLICCCCVSLKHKTNKNTAVVDQAKAVDETDLNRLNRNISQRMPMVIRNPGATNYEESELEDERRLKHFERIFSEMRRSGRHSIPASAHEDQTESRKCLSEFSHPYTADGSANL